MVTKVKGRPKCCTDGNKGQGSSFKNYLFGLYTEFCIRDTVMRIMAQLNPEGAQQRRQRRLKVTVNRLVYAHTRNLSAIQNVWPYLTVLA